MNVRESDITFNDDLEEENLIMIKEQTEDMDYFPIIPIKNQNYLKFHI
jgi:hypothetical protein